MAGAPPLVIGLDCSTTACKAIVWDAHGNRVQEGRAPLPLEMPAPGWHEQPAQAWWQSACLALRQACAGLDPRRLKAISIAHQRETFVPVDSNGLPLRPAILWMDLRAEPLLPELSSRLDPRDFHCRTGKILSANLVPGKLEWLRRNEPGIFRQAAYYLDVSAFLVHRLSGEYATSTASADPMGLYDLSSGCWDERTLAVLELSPAQMPPAYPPGQVLGRVQAGAGRESGLPEGLPVVAGLGDGQAGALGSGLTAGGELSLSLGTSIIGATHASAYLTSPAFRTMGSALPGAYVLETVLLGGVYTLHWLIDRLLGLPDFPAAQNELETAAASLPLGSQGLLLLPYWNGAMNPYWDGSASGLILGLRGIHGPAHFYRAILEGISFELRLPLEGLRQALGAPLGQLVISGGGARSPLWRSILASITGLPVIRCETLETASLGAAVLAAAAAGLHPDVFAAARAMTRRSTQPDLPDPRAFDACTKLYERAYRPLYPALREVMAELARREE